MTLQKPHTGETLDEVDGSIILNCTECGFAHVMPLPSDEELKAFYEKDFYDTERPDYFKNAEKDMEWWMATYNHYYDLLEAHTKGRRLLDIGSGPGYFLDAGVKRGWEVLGFEPSPAAAHYSSERGLTVVNDMFSAEKAASHGLFDAIMISLVLEHVPDPITFIEEAKKVLAPGGLLCVIVPNDYNPLQKLLRAHAGFKPWWVVPKHHLNYFSVASLQKLFTKEGLEPVEVETTYPMELYLLAGRNYIEDSIVGRECHAERKALEMMLYRHDRATLQALYRSFAENGIGRQAVIIGKKL